MKPWWKSKTIWFNLAIVGGAVLSGAVGLLPLLEPLMAPAAYAVIFFVVGVVNVGLRAITEKGIGSA